MARRAGKRRLGSSENRARFGLAPDVLDRFERWTIPASVDVGQAATDGAQNLLALASINPRLKQLF